MIEIVTANLTHVGPIATRIREADRLECEAFGRSPKTALRVGLRASTLALTAKLNGKPIAMFGVVPNSLLESRGQPWLLGTDDVLDHARTFIEAGPRILSRMSASYRRLENHVWVGNHRAIRLLRHWGFSVGGDAMNFGGLPFVPFWREV